MGPMNNVDGKLHVDMVLDLICVHSYIGFTRLERAVARWRKQGGDIEIRFAPFELAPGAPTTGSPLAAAPPNRSAGCVPPLLRTRRPELPHARRASTQANIVMPTPIISTNRKLVAIVGSDEIAMPGAGILIDKCRVALALPELGKDRQNISLRPRARDGRNNLSASLREHRPGGEITRGTIKVWASIDSSVGR